MKTCGSLRALFSSCIDYAGLFPPAGLGMAEVLERFVRYRQGPGSWMLGRLVLPLSRLRELEPLEASGLASLSRWPVSLLLPKDAGSHLDDLEAAFDRWGGRLGVVSLEVPPLDSPQAVTSLAGRLPAGVESYFELDWAGDPDEYLAAIAVSGAAAKLRTGGILPELFPDPARLAERVWSCARNGVAFKATAGLHHPVRGRHPLTYAPDSPQAPMHGFVNLYLLAALFHSGKVGPEEGARVLEDGAEGFRFEEEQASWRGRVVEVQEMEACRVRLLHSFGSCSFEEPLAGLSGMEPSR